MVGRYAAKVGIAERVTPHTLRHTFGTALLRATGNVALVQKALGYANLSTTHIYLHLVDGDLEEALRAFHLRD